MRVGLIDVDGHNFPNLALMRISKYYKNQGHKVEWWMGDIWHYDVVFMSKVFSNAYSPEPFDPVNVDKLIKGGTGYCIDLEGGREVFDESKNESLPPSVEKMRPDYSIYPYDFAIAMTSRGCPRGCEFCHVSKKEGKKSRKVANVADFYEGQGLIVSLDPNILACRDRIDLLEQYAETGAEVNYSQGLDIRLMSGEVLDVLNKTRLKSVHFAWDNPKDNLEGVFKEYAKNTKNRPHGRCGVVYVLVNFNSTIEEDLHRIYTLRDLNFDPYVMVYDKPHASKTHRDLQRWCNNVVIFRSTKTFSEYRG